MKVLAQAAGIKLANKIKECFTNSPPETGIVISPLKKRLTESSLSDLHADYSEEKAVLEEWVKQVLNDEIAVSDLINLRPDDLQEYATLKLSSGESVTLKGKDFASVCTVPIFDPETGELQSYKVVSKKEALELFKEHLMELVLAILDGSYKELDINKFIRIMLHNHNSYGFGPSPIDLFSVGGQKSSLVVTTGDDIVYIIKVRDGKFPPKEMRDYYELFKARHLYPLRSSVLTEKDQYSRDNMLEELNRSFEAVNGDLSPGLEKIYKAAIDSGDETLNVLVNSLKQYKNMKIPKHFSELSLLFAVTNALEDVLNLKIRDILEEKALASESLLHLPCPEEAISFLVFNGSSNDSTLELLALAGKNMKDFYDNPDEFYKLFDRFGISVKAIKLSEFIDKDLHKKFKDKQYYSLSKSIRKNKELFLDRKHKGSLETVFYKSSDWRIKAKALHLLAKTGRSRMPKSGELQFKNIGEYLWACSEACYDSTKYTNPRAFRYLAKEALPLIKTKGDLQKVLAKLNARASKELLKVMEGGVIRKALAYIKQS